MSEVQNEKLADAPDPADWGAWADEYWTVYPDGTAIRKQVLWTDHPEREASEFQESIVIMGAGERPEDALIRELAEELGITVKEPCLAPFTFASHTYDAFHLLMPLYVCRRWDGVPQPRHHAVLKWVRPRDLMGDTTAYPMPAADLPLIPMLRDLL